MQQRHRREKQAAKVDEGGMVCVSGSGYIQIWQPLYSYKRVFYCDSLRLASLLILIIAIYRYEDAAQVFLLVLTCMARSCIWEENQRRLEEGHCELRQHVLPE